MKADLMQHGGERPQHAMVEGGKTTARGNATSSRGRSCEVSRVVSWGVVHRVCIAIELTTGRYEQRDYWTWCAADGLSAVYSDWSFQSNRLTNVLGAEIKKKIMMCDNAKSGGQMKSAQANNNTLKAAEAVVPRLMKHLSLQLRKHLQRDRNSSDETNFSHWLWSFYPNASKFQKKLPHAEGIAYLHEGLEIQLENENNSLFGSRLPGPSASRMVHAS
ncbi:hypothetical protein Tco_0808054 [Tanacetum coccineum]